MSASKCEEVAPQAGDSLVANGVERTTPTARRNALYKQLLLAAAVLLLAISVGMSVGFMFIASVFEERFDYKPRSLGLGLFSWFMTKCGLFDSIGSLFAGYLMDRKGRRFVCILAVCPFVISWPLFAIAPNPIFHGSGLMFAGQLFASFGLGLFWPSAQILLAECTQPQIRGLLVATPFVGYTLGVLLTTALGAVLSAPSIAFGPIIVPIIAAGCLWYVPESPAWLVRVGDRERALAALLWLHGGDETAAQRQLTVITDRLEHEQSVAMTSSQTATVVEKIRSACSSTLRPISVILVVYVVAMLVGINLVTLDMIRKVFDAKQFGSVSTVIHTVGMRMAALVVCLVMVHTMPRRILVQVGIYMAAISSLAVFGQKVVFGQHSDVESFGALFAMTCALAYILASTVLIVCSLIVISELLPANGRGKWCGICFCVIHFIYVVVTQVFLQTAVMLGGVYILVVLIAAVATLGSVMMFAVLPETRGLTLEQIEDFFRSGRQWTGYSRRPAVAVPVGVQEVNV